MKLKPILHFVFFGWRWDKLIYNQQAHKDMRKKIHNIQKVADFN